VVQLQAQLKQAAIGLIKQMDAVFTAKVDEIGAVGQSLWDDVASTRQLLDVARSNLGLDGTTDDGTLESANSSLVSRIHTVCEQLSNALNIFVKIQGPLKPLKTGGR